MSRVIIFLLLFISLRTFAMPMQMLWAWEAPQDLSLIDPEKTGVATLAATITLHSRGVNYYLRQQPLSVPPKTHQIAVIHMTARRGALLTPEIAESVAQQISRIYHLKSYQGLQIDFEPKFAERDFYKILLTLLRKKVGSDTPISITALASWCTNDKWIGKANLPIDFVVPMYFSLSNNATARQNFIDHFPKDIKKLAPECQSAIGIATFENWEIPLRATVPVFVFTRKSWQTATLLYADKLCKKIQTTLPIIPAKAGTHFWSDSLIAISR